MLRHSDQPGVNRRVIFPPQPGSFLSNRVTRCLSPVGYLRIAGACPRSAAAGGVNLRSRRLLATTDTLEKLIAALATIGDRRQPSHG